MTPRLTGYLISITGVSIWSTTPIFVGYLITHYHMPALLLAFWRNLFVCLVLVPALLIFRPSLLKAGFDQLKLFFSYGLFLALFNSIWTISVKANGAGVATVLAYSSASFTAVMAWRFFQEKLGFLKISSVILSITGCIMVTNAFRPDMWKLNPIGIATGILSGIMFACYNMVGKEASKRNINPWKSLFYSFAFGSVFILVFNMFSFLPGAAGNIENILPELTADGWLVLLGLSVPSILGYGMYIASMDYLPVSIASLLATTEPVMTAILAYILLHERMTFSQIIGSGLILSAVTIVQFEKDETAGII